MPALRPGGVVLIPGLRTRLIVLRLARLSRGERIRRSLEKGETRHELRPIWWRKPPVRLWPQGDAQDKVLRLWIRIRSTLQADGGESGVLPDMLPEAQAPTKRHVLS